MEPQGFELRDIEEGKVKEGGSITFKAARNVLPRPQAVSVSVEEATTWLRYINLAGRERHLDGMASVLLSAKLPVRVANVPMSMYDYGAKKVIATEKTDRNGVAVFSMRFSEPQVRKVLVFPGKYYIPGVSEALGDVIGIKVYEVHVRTRNKTDRWARFQGRSVAVKLPFHFWWYPGFNIGLAGWAEWIELVPVINGMKVRYEIGVSAACNTPEPYPPVSKCCEYRKHTWWVAELWYRTSPLEGLKKAGSDDINISFHSLYYIEYDDITHKGRCLANWDPSGKVGLCGWERNVCKVKCSER